MTLKIYKVGGFVRDTLLGIKPTDTDYVVVGATIDEMLQQGFIPVGKDFPVFLHPTTHEEYALARTERKTNLGYKGFNFYTNQDVTLFDDLKRRDITINAIAMDMDGNLYDPFNGITDLKNKIIRHVSEAFCEDPLRVIRVARFGAKYNFTIAPATIQLMKKITKLNLELESISIDRLYNELTKIIDYDFLTFFDILYQCHALNKIFIEFKPLVDIIDLQNIIRTNFYNNTSIYKQLGNHQKIILLLLILNIFLNNKKIISIYITNKNHIDIMNKTLDIYYIILQINPNNNIDTNSKLYLQIILKIGSHTQIEKSMIILLLTKILLNIFNLNKLNYIVDKLHYMLNIINKINYQALVKGKKTNEMKEIIYNYKLDCIKNILENKYSD
jgi:tRNA nucleotidyltransferase/poly(A) polymerase